MRARSAAELLVLPVRLHGIQLGRPVDLLLDATGLRVVGFEVKCGDREHRVLPFAAVEARADELAVDSALLLLDDAHASFYRRTGVTLRTLLGRVVERAGGSHGALRDLLVAPDGAVEAVVAELAGARTELRVDESVRIVPRAVSAA